MVSATANTMEAFSLNTGTISNLDTLARTATFKAQGQYGEELMDISLIIHGKCFNCDSKGHIAR